jgi:hypothetical protein
MTHETVTYGETATIHTSKACISYLKNAQLERLGHSGLLIDLIDLRLMD